MKCPTHGFDICSICHDASGELWPEAKPNPLVERITELEQQLAGQETRIQGLVEALERIGSVEIDGWEDNLAIILCSYFEDHSECPDQELDETGWKPWAVEKCREMLRAISNSVTAYKEGK